MTSNYEDIENALSVSESFNSDSSLTEQRVRLNHDLRTSVSSILGLAQIARNNASRDFVNDCLAGIETSSKQLLSLIDALYGIDSKRIAIPEQPPARADLSGVSVLLAEDDLINQQIAQFFLEEAGAHVIPTCNGEEAWNAYKDSPEGYFDAIVTDIEMPKMDGYELSRSIRSCERIDSHTMPIVALTAHTLEESVKAGKDSDINAHVTKPLDMEIMIATLSALVTGKEVSAEADTVSVGKRLGWLVEFVLLKKSIASAIKKSAGLNYTQGRILLHVASNPPETIGAIATSLHLSSNTVTTSVDALEKRGYAVRDAGSGEDKREVRLSTTKAGRKAACQYVVAVNDSIKAQPFWKAAKEKGVFTYAPVASSSLGSFFGKMPLEKTAQRASERLGLSGDEVLSADEVSNITLAEMALCCLTELSIVNRRSGLKGNESLILRILAKDDASLCSSAIGKMINAGANTMAVSTGSLYEHGYIARKQDPHDARAVLLSLTKEGKELLRTSNPQYCSVFDSRYPGLREIDIEELAGSEQ